MNEMPVRAISIPEESIIDALMFDPLGAARVLDGLCESPQLRHSSEVMVDIGRERGLRGERLRDIVNALVATGLVRHKTGNWELAISRSDGKHRAAFLRGLAYAKDKQRDTNQVEITLSPPSRPSRLMELLPKQGFAWAGLYDTKDSLIELASLVQKQLIVVTPFIDAVGLDWIEQLFAWAPESAQRVLVVRAADERIQALVAQRKDTFKRYSARVFSYAIQHDALVRKCALETFHAKIILADKERAYIGSSNMNRASREVSLECGVMLTGPCVRPVATLVETIIAISTLL